MKNQVTSFSGHIIFSLPAILAGAILMAGCDSNGADASAPTQIPMEQATMTTEKSTNQTISLQQAKALQDDGSVLIDVREPDEWAEGYADGALLISRGDITDRIASAVPDTNTAIVTYCRSGKRAAMAAETLSELGYTRVVSMQGGYSDWEEAGFPVVQNP